MGMGPERFGMALDLLDSALKSMMDEDPEQKIGVRVETLRELVDSVRVGAGPFSLMARDLDEARGKQAEAEKLAAAWRQRYYESPQKQLDGPKGFEIMALEWLRDHKLGAVITTFSHTGAKYCVTQDTDHRTCTPGNTLAEIVGVLRAGEKTEGG